MDHILESDGRTFGYLHITGPGEFNSPFGTQPFACLVWDADSGLNAGDRQRLANAVIGANSRYVVCGGSQCEAWHDAMDQAFLELDLQGEEYEERFVMTTWHTDEDEDEVATFFIHCTPSDEDEVATFFIHCTPSDEEPFTKYLVLQVGGGWDAMNRLKTAVREQVNEEADDDHAPEREDV